MGSKIFSSPQITSSMLPVNAVSIIYEGDESEDIIVSVDNTKRTISAKLKNIQYNNFAEFPSVGSENIIYIDKSTNSAYRFDLSKNEYVSLFAKETKKTVEDISFNEANGVFTVTYSDKTTATINTKLENVVVNFAYDATSQSLVLKLDDGTSYSIPMSSFINIYNGSNGNMITISIDKNNNIYAEIVDGSITAGKLEKSFVDNLCTKDDLNGIVGDINTALTSILGV